MTDTTSPVVEHDRVQVLDVLRGIALVGMFLVHFSMFSSGGGAADQLYQKTIALRLEERLWAMFAMLFGVGSAVQLRGGDPRARSVISLLLARAAGVRV